MNNFRDEDKPFSGTHVGALIESFRNDMSIMAEQLDTVSSDVAILKEDVKELKTDMRTVKDVLRVFIPEINARITALEIKTGI
ncbi:MAG: hypothetical protein EXS63_00815 [Candidatus Omnitrophica bacterium]|nr:hypothetical protein [Candidatus Omnitrophota bacterium]